MQENSQNFDKNPRLVPEDVLEGGEEGEEGLEHGQQPARPRRDRHQAHFNTVP